MPPKPEKRYYTTEIAVGHIREASAGRDAQGQPIAEETEALAIQDLLRPDAGGLIPGFQVGDDVFIPGDPDFDPIPDSSSGGSDDIQFLGGSDDIEFTVISEETASPGLSPFRGTLMEAPMPNAHLGRNMSVWGEPVVQVLVAGFMIEGTMVSVGACFVTQKFVDFLRPPVPPVDIRRVIVVRDGKKIAWRTT